MAIFDVNKFKIIVMGDRPRIKNEAQYDALRDQGYSKEKSARIANSPNAGKRGGEASAYEDRTKSELYEQAKDLDIEGRSKMSKDELISALRNH
ncbi:DUF7218 family protein [Formosa sp. 3Alg 14/1]|uniref:DUF7218 family protein n=1 Tax=unclassified Formosa TaxID=2644710 RepID=UPI0039BDF8F3